MINLSIWMKMANFRIIILILWDLSQMISKNII